MNKLAHMSIAAAFAVGSIGTVRADDGAFSKSRAEVVAEMAMARISGEMNALNGEDSGSSYLSRGETRGTTDTATPRATVRAQRIAARQAGEIDFSSEDSGSFALSRTTASSGVSRAEIVAELKRARESGELVALNGEDSGSAYLSRPMPAHWMRYAGPDIRRASTQPDARDLG